MDDDTNPDRLLSELPPSPIQQDEPASTSTGTAQPEESSVPAHGIGAYPALDPSAKQVEEVINSDVCGFRNLVATSH